nr:hypothetical protein [uncultured Undibacterium sp.]
MTSFTQAKSAPISRAPKINGSIATPIRLSPDEFEVANRYAASQERSRAAFMRSMYLRGLRSFELEQHSQT